jgi:hypothetical protein
MRTRLTERDLNRIVRRVINEGVVIPYKECTSEWTQSDTTGNSWSIGQGVIYLEGADGKPFCKISTIR